jgi:hypothetical protein
MLTVISTCQIAALAAEAEARVRRLDREAPAVVVAGVVQHAVGAYQRRYAIAGLRRVLAAAVLDLRIEAPVELHGADGVVAERDLRVRGGRGEKRTHRERGCFPPHCSPPPEG